MYFDRCKTTGEARGLYRALARENHPDHGGDLRTMQEINAEYAAWCSTHAKDEAYQRQADAHKEGRKSAADFHDINAVAEELRAAILFGLSLEGVEVELMGLWVWLTGNTKPHREQIKEHGFKWAPVKQAWYFAGIPSMSRKEHTLDSIRNMYGSVQFARRAEEDSPAQLA